MNFLVIIEPTATGFSAYAPDLDGCIATGASREEVERRMREAIAFDLDGMQAEGMPLPVPQSEAVYVELSP